MRPVAGDWIRVAILLKPVLPRIDSCFHASIQSLTALLCHRIMTFLRARYGSFNEDVEQFDGDPLADFRLECQERNNSFPAPHPKSLQSMHTTYPISHENLSVPASVFPPSPLCNRSQVRRNMPALIPGNLLRNTASMARGE